MKYGSNGSYQEQRSTDMGQRIDNHPEGEYFEQELA